MHEISAVIDRLAVAFEESTTPFVAGSDRRVLITAGVFVDLTADSMHVAQPSLHHRELLWRGRHQRTSPSLPAHAPSMMQNDESRAADLASTASRFGHNGRMGSLLVVTGPPGAGKSTLAEVLAIGMNSSVLVEGDAFFRFLRNGAIDPWLPEANDQNTIVTQVAGAAAGRFTRGGFHTVYDGVIGPWFLDEFLASTGLAALDYVVLLPPADTCVNRVLTRKNHGFIDENAARHMHDHFTRQPPADRHIINPVDQSPDRLSTLVLDARNRGDLRYPAR